MWATPQRSRRTLTGRSSPGIRKWPETTARALCAALTRSGFWLGWAKSARGNKRISRRTLFIEDLIVIRSPVQQWWPGEDARRSTGKGNEVLVAGRGRPALHRLGQ